MDDANTNNISIDDRKAVIAIMKAVVETVVECEREMDGHGSPGTAIWLAMEQVGITFEKYEGMMAGMVEAGALVRNGHVYNSTSLGKAFVRAAEVNAKGGIN